MLTAVGATQTRCCVANIVRQVSAAGESVPRGKTDVEGVALARVRE